MENLNSQEELQRNDLEVAVKSTDELGGVDLEATHTATNVLENNTVKADMDSIEVQENDTEQPLLNTEPIPQGDEPIVSETPTGDLEVNPQTAEVHSPINEAVDTPADNLEENKEEAPEPTRETMDRLEETPKIDVQTEDLEATQEAIVENATKVDTEQPSETELEDEHDPELLTYKISVDTDDDNADYSTLGKEELVALAEKAVHTENLKEAAEVMKGIRPVLDNIFAEEYNTALATFIEEGNDKDAFEYKEDGLKQQFYDAFKTVQRRRADERGRAEQEKVKNLEAKRKILEKLSELTDSDETEASLEQVKELQREWKKIRVVPQEFAQELWDSYRFYLDKFYDNVSINNELKELDRKKNLEAKIELCKKVGELQEEKSIKKALILLNKYHDEWKNTGPVPREYSDDIWKRFKEASDIVYEQKRGEIAKLQEVRVQNLELKTAICERLELLTATRPAKPKEWIEMTRQVNTLFDEWRKVGKVPRENNEEIWTRFRELRNNFFNDKNTFFRSHNAEKAENLKRKTEICEQAEALKESDDWQRTANQLKRMQDEWRKVGPVPDKLSEPIWKRFRSACDEFFNRKESHFKVQRDEHTQNLELKTAILTRLEELANIEGGETENVFAQAKQIQKEWSEIGFVPLDMKKDLQARFSGAIDKIYKKLNRNPEEMSEARLKEHYEEISKMPDFKYKLTNEERRVKERIKFLKTDIETLENNIGFFKSGNSKGSNPLVKQIEDKIAKANGQLSRLERELKVIRTYAN